MKLKKVISGGQTGADRAGLEEASRLGLKTGGHAPRGFRTEFGNDPSLEAFGLVETASSDYPSRTRLNVENSEVTVWFGTLGSPGYKLTKKYARELSKPLYENPDAELMVMLADLYEVWNVAGNRISKYPRVDQLVRTAFEALAGGNHEALT